MKRSDAPEKDDAQKEAVAKSKAVKHKPPPSKAPASAEPAKPPRLVSLDAYRGMIMTMLAASGFGVLSLSRLPEDAPVWQTINYDFWQALAFHFDHPVWNSQFNLVGVSFWDLIQPAFMFMVGVAMPYSYARRAASGHSSLRQFVHALWRGLVLVLMGVFLQSQRTPQTNWIFTNVLSQIGLGYIFLYLLMGRHLVIQVVAFFAIMVGSWLFFFLYSVPADYDYAAVKAAPETVYENSFAPWSKNANAGHALDVKLLKKFPREKPFTPNDGGYLTFNFVPSIATMMLGMFSGMLLRSNRGNWHKFGMLMAGGAILMLLGIVAGQWLCPIVKRIWTPSWVLFSGAWVVWMLALFYLVFDLFRLRWLAFPLVVVGMNSIAMYMMGQLMRGWTTKMVNIHLRLPFEQWLGAEMLSDRMFGRMVTPTMAFLMFWFIAYWMYRQKFFVRV